VTFFYRKRNKSIQKIKTGSFC
jgi:hypothetical protein